MKTMNSIVRILIDSSFSLEVKYTCLVKWAGVLSPRPFSEMVAHSSLTGLAQER